ncbi:MAG TPA: ATP-binding protein [Luteitalea sp.]|nr:ATP-binding protein [Luteitalea sp.]
MTPAPPPSQDVAVDERPDPRASATPGPVDAVTPAPDEAYDTLAHAISHDLRAPLRAIEGYALALAEDFGRQLPLEARDFVSRIRAATQTVEQRVDALLRLSQLGRGALASERCDLSVIATPIVADLRRTAPTRRATVIVPPSMLVLGDGTLLGIALENLLGNAWKFTRLQPAPVIEVGLHPAGEEAVVFVRDNGVGFDMRHAHRLGVPFQRLHDGSTFEGTGIGLASTRRIVERHGGRLWAEASPGEGATFYLSLPSVRTR